MKLIEQLKQAWLDDPEGHLNEITRFANGYVADVPGPWDEPSDPLDELLAILHRLDDIAHRRGRPSAGLASWDTPTEDFREILVEEGVTEAEIEAKIRSERRPAENEAKVLRALFVELCHALHGTGWTYTSGQQSHITTAMKGVPDSAQLAAALEGLKGENETKVATLPASNTRRGRASRDRAVELFEKWTSRGRLSCLLGEFLAWMGPASSRSLEVPAKPLEWRGAEAEKDTGREKALAEFILDYAQAVRIITGPSDRELPVKAICAAFGITDRRAVERIGRRARREKNQNKPSKSL
ncbi:MAG: hypothetical protein IJI97_02665 [Clostridia bacterium]|nr:hypothetical protein [Clostridia bacterium]